MRRVLVLSALVLGAPAFGPPATAQPLTAPPSATQAALDHLRAVGPSRGLSQQDLGELVAVASHVSSRTGLTYVYVRQQRGGLDVTDAIASVVLSPANEPLRLAESFVRRLHTGPRLGAGLTALDALRRAAPGLGRRFEVVAEAEGPARRTVVREVDAQGRPLPGDPLKAQMVYARVNPDGPVVLAWENEVASPDGTQRWIVRTDAGTGAELERFPILLDEVFHRPPRSFAPTARGSVATPFVAPPRAPRRALVPTYTVFALPVESPIHSGTPPPGDGRTAVASPADALASPFGWHDTDGVAGDEYTITRGNNTHAYLDTDDDDSGDAGDSPDCGAGIACSFPLDLTGLPGTYADAATTNLFYWTNVAHDVLYGYGFTEAAGNFQVDGYGRGGLNDDDVRAEAQDHGDTDNANFLLAPDGERPRMQMFLWGDPDPTLATLDSDLDNLVIVHEYAHGLSTRLVGGPSTISCLHNTEQMGEGWSDWYGLMFTMDGTDTGLDARGIGNYVTGAPAGGPGIRLAPYSTDFGANAFTYADTPPLVLVHEVGFVWATILWEATWAMIDALGFDPDLYDEDGGAGNQVMLDIVTEGLKGTECSPGFTVARDAILKASAELYPDLAFPDADVGLYDGILWEAFSERGLGVSANQFSPFTNADNVPGFDVPPPPGSSDVTPTSVSATVAPGGSDLGSLTLSYTGPPMPPSMLTFTATVEDATVPGPPPLAGGPDAYGYTFLDSDEVGGPPVAFEDISPGGTGTGTPLGPWLVIPGAFAATDEGYVDVPLPFDFPFYGRNQSLARVFVNGMISFSGYELYSFENEPIPSATEPNGLIAPFWDDLLLGTGTVYAGPHTDGRFVIQYDGVTDAATSASYTFEIILAPDGAIEVQYGTMTGTVTGATVGIENHAGDDGLEVVKDGPYVTSGKALAFTGPTLWAIASPGEGVLPPGGSTPITVLFDASALGTGVYTTDLVVATNDPGVPEITIPLTLTVSGDGTRTITGAAGWRIIGPPAAGITVDDLAALNLVAGVPGYYPTFGGATLLTDYDGTSWIDSGGTGETLELGHGATWYFYDAMFTPAVATTFPSSSEELPVTLTSPVAPNVADADVTLHADGNRFNVLGNPFGAPLDLTGLVDWPGGGKVASKGRSWVWDVATSTWLDGATVGSVEPWEGFVVRAKMSAGGKTLTIPTSAAKAARPRAAAPALAFELSGREAGTGRLLRDADLAVAFDPEATAGEDDGDAPKLAPLSESFVLLGVGAEAEGGAVLRARESRPPGEPFALPLALATAGAERDLVLRWTLPDGLPAGLAVTLEDLATGETVDLRAARAYAFEAAPQPRKAGPPRVAAASASEAAPRFLLRVGPPEAPEPPEAFALAPVMPNPARDEARVAFSLATADETEVAVFDVRGREVARLASGWREVGRHALPWPTRGLAPGVYVVRLASGGFVATRRAVVAR